MLLRNDCFHALIYKKVFQILSFLSHGFYFAHRKVLPRSCFLPPPWFLQNTDTLSYSFHSMKNSSPIPEKNLQLHIPAPMSFHLPSGHADGSGFFWFFLCRVHLLPQHIPVLLYHTSDYKEAVHFPVYTIQPEFLLPSTGHPVFCF